MKIPITKPYFDQAERQAVIEPLESGWVAQGPKVEAFEDEVRAFAGAAHACATTSCTTAIHLALVAAGVGPGDEVILPAFTFVASANAVEYTGARPVFVDIDLGTFNVATSCVEAAITARTKAILPVHLFGLCCDMKPILQLAAKHSLRVVEDAACAIGGFYCGKHAGTMGDAGCLSFHPRKSITTGEGGMVLTNDREFAHQVEILRDHGAELSDLGRQDVKQLLLPEYNHLGYNYRMTDFQAALGVSQMRKLSFILERKRKLAGRYCDALGDLKWLQLPVALNGYEHSYQSFVCLFQPESLNEINPERLSRLHKMRNELMNRLNDQGISTRQGTHAVHALGYYRSKYTLEPWDYPKAWIADHLTLALPLYPQMTDQEQAFVCDALRRGLRV